LEVLFDDLDLVVCHSYLVPCQSSSEFLSREHVVPVLIVFIELHRKVQVKSSALSRQWLYYILDTEAECFLFDEIRRDDMKEVCFGDLALVASIKVFLYVIDLSLN